MNVSDVKTVIEGLNQRLVKADSLPWEQSVPEAKLIEAAAVALEAVLWDLEPAPPPTEDDDETPERLEWEQVYADLDWLKEGCQAMFFFYGMARVL